MRIPFSIAHALAGIALLVATPMASAAMFKCKDAAGAITFSDRPCGGTQEVVAVPGAHATMKAHDDPPQWCNLGPAPQTLVDTCLDEWRKRMRDPRSAAAAGGTLTRNTKSHQLDVFVKVTTKDTATGATSAMEIQCGRTEGNTIALIPTQQWFAQADVAEKESRGGEAHDLIQCEDSQAKQ
jgi:hypothetical protein